MPDGEAWLFRPFTEGNIFGLSYSQLYDGTLDISDIARMNQILDVRAENEYRASEAMKRK